MALTVNVELTDHCNLRCSMCSQAWTDTHGVPKRFMSWETWKKALEGLQGMPAPVTLCPHWLGEPTTHPDFIPMIEYAFSRNWQNRLFRTFKLHTNGILFGQDRALRLLRLAARPGLALDTFHTIHFSVDALDRAVYQRLKGGDHGPRVQANILDLLDARHRLGLDWPHVHIAFVVQPENAHEARNFVAHWGHILSRQRRRWVLSADWPDPSYDAIYLRPLNCSDQDAADALHWRVCSAFGLSVDRPWTHGDTASQVPHPTQPARRLRATESF